MGYLFTKPDSAFYYAQLQYDFAKTRGLQKDMANALNTQGVAFHLRGDYSQAIDYHTRSLKIREEIGDKAGITSAYNNIGVLYQEQGDYAQAITYYAKSLKIYEETGNEEIVDKYGLASLLNRIGIIYETQGEYEFNNENTKLSVYMYRKAIHYYSKSLMILEEIDYKEGIALSLCKIGLIYQEQSEYAQAMTYYDKSLKIYEEIGDKLGIANSYNNIGNIYCDQGDYAQAMTYYTQNLKLYKDHGVKKLIAMSLGNIGVVYRRQGDYASSRVDTKLSADMYSQAINYYTQSLELDEEIINKPGIALGLSNIGYVYMKLGDNIKSLDKSKKALVLAKRNWRPTNNKRGFSFSLFNKLSFEE